MISGCGLVGIFIGLPPKQRQPQIVNHQSKCSGFSDKKYRAQHALQWKSFSVQFKLSLKNR